ncbi:DUF6442 family protein [Lapidilactobacillus wuchangensis]|uniref:DUF6442 family protein n=1 Tax=Lapidilactobacillus wuchangensis TaxID=2486001 RepID=UPI000F7AD719|nr:DUF6442 family protein [Lapidilactobacillus wuchangensis]
MNKEEILAKNRHDNINGDERQKQLQLQNIVDSYLVLLALFGVCLGINAVTLLFWKFEFTDTKTIMMAFVLVVTVMSYRKFQVEKVRKNRWSVILSFTALVAILAAIILRGLGK